MLLPPGGIDELRAMFEMAAEHNRDRLTSGNSWQVALFDLVTLLHLPPVLWLRRLLGRQERRMHVGG